MNFLKKLWPYSFDTNNVSSLVVKTLLYVLLAVSFSILMGVLAKVAVLNVLFFIISPLIDLYVVVGLIVLYLNFFNIIK